MAKGCLAAAPLLEPGLWLQQPCSPIVHLHNGCLFIHYANGMRGKLGNKGRRKEKIALACFNILFISNCCGLQKAETHGIPASGNMFSPFSYERFQAEMFVFLLLFHGFCGWTIKIIMLNPRRTNSNSPPFKIDSIISFSFLLLFYY